MGAPYNPIASGILRGVQLAMMIRQQQQAEQDRTTRLEEVERRRKREEETDALERLRTQLSLDLDPRLEPVGAGQTSRQTSVTIPESLRSTLPGERFGLEVPVERTIDYGGRRYAVRGRAELLEDQLQQARRTQALELDKVRAVERLRRTLAGDAQFVRRSREGVPVPAELASRFGVPAGTLLLPDELARLHQAFREPAGRAAPRPHFTTSDTGEVTAVDPVTLAKRPLGRIGKSKPVPSVASGAAQTLAGQRFEESKRQAARRELERIETEETKLHSQRLQLGRILQSGKLLSGEKVSDEQAARLHRELAVATGRLNQLLQRKVALGFTTAEHAGLATPKPEAARAPAAAQPEPAAGKPKRGDRATYLGASYTFNGTEWVRD